MKQLAVLLMVLVGCDSMVDTATESATAVRPQVELVQQAMTCVQWVGVFCIMYAPDAPTGFQDCGGDTNVYAGEIVIFTQTNYGGYCFWARPAPARLNSSMGDLASPWTVKSIKSRLTNGGTLYNTVNFGGSFYILFGGSHDVADMGSFVTKSLQAYN